jgi:hypothetical protein
MSTTLSPAAPQYATTSDKLDVPVVVTRRRIDRLLVAAGAVVAVVLAVAGGLLQWGTNFSGDYVTRELTSQNIFFPSADALTKEGRTDLLSYAGRQVTNGNDAEAYASYIDHHLDGIAEGKTFADLGAVERAAKGDVTAAAEAGKPADEIATLQATADGITRQRDSLFRGETLRGLLLSTYAWGTIGTIAAIASWVAFAAAVVMLVLVAFGVAHLRNQRPAA